MQHRACTIGNELTGQQAMALAARLASLSLDDVGSVSLSLRKVTEVDASGLAVLIRLYSRLSRAGKRLVLHDIRPEVEQLLRRIGLESVLVKKDETPTIGEWIRSGSQPAIPISIPGQIAPELLVPSVSDLVDALAQLDTDTAVLLLRKAEERLGLTPDGLIAVPSGLTASSAAEAPDTPASARVFKRTPSARRKTPAKEATQWTGDGSVAAERKFPREPTPTCWLNPQTPASAIGRRDRPERPIPTIDAVLERLVAESLSDSSPGERILAATGKRIRSLALQRKTSAGSRVSSATPPIKPTPAKQPEAVPNARSRSSQVPPARQQSKSSQVPPARPKGASIPAARPKGADIRAPSPRRPLQRNSSACWVNPKKKKAGRPLPEPRIREAPLYAGSVPVPAVFPAPPPEAAAAESIAAARLLAITTERYTTRLSTEKPASGGAGASARAEALVPRPAQFAAAAPSRALSLKPLSQLFRLCRKLRRGAPGRAKTDSAVGAAVPTCWINPTTQPRLKVPPATPENPVAAIEGLLVRYLAEPLPAYSRIAASGS